jgi:hypothetical protein
MLRRGLRLNKAAPAGIEGYPRIASAESCSTPSMRDAKVSASSPVMVTA